MGIRFIENEEKERCKLQEVITASVEGCDSSD
jgi:hypothetical protein